jgi:coenzyme F420-0:L-glutamate ligase / coenzyme F420-1:gamma-L-glutamate ligase
VNELRVWAPDGLREVVPGDDLVALLVVLLQDDARAHPDRALADGDLLVLTSKVVSKAEGRVVAADDREQAITDETVRVVATREHAGGVTRIVENRLGLVMAAAGVDASNTPRGTVLLLPVDPDASARALRAALPRRPAVVIADSFGRAWRHGQCDVAVGIAGLAAIDDWRGRRDPTGLALRATAIAVADQAAAAADLVRDKASREPAVVVRGLGRFVTEEDGPGAAALVRTLEEDLFR